MICRRLLLQKSHSHRLCLMWRSRSRPPRLCRQDHMQCKWRIHAIHNMYRVKLGKEHMILGQPAQTSVFFFTR